MLDVWCSETELAEYGQVIEVGESIRRLGVQSQEVWFGTGLDQIEYRFDRYAEVVGGLTPLAIAGEVVSIAAIYVLLTERDGAWDVQLGSSWLEPLSSTRQTRRPPRRIAWTESGPNNKGDVHRWGRPDYREGDESLWGWRLSLAEATIEPW